jgi:hypothetical protein
MRPVVAGAPCRAADPYNGGVEHLLEYQDYILAYRLRVLVGNVQVGNTARPAYLSLAEYAGKRLERQALAKSILKSQDYRGALREVEALTDALNFGFWHNPAETIDFLKRVIEGGGCAALESPEAFVNALLTRSERVRLGDAPARLVAVYYLGLLRASASHLDAETFTRLRAEIEPLRERLPFFVVPEETFPVVETL